jgi:hypothetical protein
MEQESVFDPANLYYGGNGGFYNPQMQRGVSQTSAQGRKGPTGDASGIVGGDGMALSGGINAAAIAEPAAYLDAQTEAELSDFTPTSVTGPAGPGNDSLFGLIAQGIADLFSGSPGPSYYQQVMELRATQGGRHPLYTAFNGISSTLIVDQASASTTLAADDSSATPIASWIWKWIKVPWHLDVVIPVLFKFVGPAVSLTYLPNFHEICGALGIGVAGGRTFSAGPYEFGNLSNANNISSGLSVSFGAQLNFILGGEIEGNSSGGLGGPTLGPRGISGAVTYGHCWSL